MINKSRLVLFARIAISATLLGVVIKYVDWSGIRQIGAQARYGPVLIALLLMMLQQVLASIKLALALQGKSPGLMNILRINLISLFLLNIMPSVVVGDLIRIAYFGSEEKIRERATAAVVVVRMSGFIVQLLFVSVSSTIAMHNDSRAQMLALFGTALLFLFCITVTLLYLFYTRLHPLFIRIWPFSHLFDIGTVIHSLTSLIKEWKRLFAILAVSIIFQFLVVWTVLLLTSALHVQMQFYEAASIMFIVTVISLFPLSFAGLGIVEVAYTALYSIFLEQKEVGTVVSLGMRAILLVPSMFGMVLFVRNSKEIKKRRDVIRADSTSIIS